jgi:hypothetical protein
MHHFYTLLAIDLANERAREAQRSHEMRRMLAGDDEPRGIRRRLTEAVRGVLSLFVDNLPDDRRTQPRLPAGHSH